VVACFRAYGSASPVGSSPGDLYKNKRDRVEMKGTNTDRILRMVEAGLGIPLVPLHPSGAVTHGGRVGIRPLK